jgi:glucose 1-dehydrogenase
LAGADITADSKTYQSLNLKLKKDKMLLNGKTALVTGANSGIGAAIAKAMAAAGANIGLNYITNEEAANQIVEQINTANGKVIALKADISKENEVENMFKTLIDRFGTINILVSNAGIQKDSPFEEMSLEQWNEVIGVNLTGAFLCARQAIREFIRRKKNESQSEAVGNIIFISSVHEVIPWAHHANYASSKGGIMMLMKTIAQEMASRKIRINSIAPGAIKTPINKNAWDTAEAEAELKKLIPYGRIGEPADIARAAVWLASNEADYITGTTLFADGGMLLYPGFRTGG